MLFRSAQEACHCGSMKEGKKLLAANQKESVRSGSSTKCMNCQQSGHTSKSAGKIGEEVLTRLLIGGKLQKKRRMVKKGERKSKLM